MCIYIYKYIHVHQGNSFRLSYNVGTYTNAIDFMKYATTSRKWTVGLGHTRVTRGFQILDFLLEKPTTSSDPLSN